MEEPDDGDGIDLHSVLDASRNVKDSQEDWIGVPLRVDTKVVDV